MHIIQIKTDQKPTEVYLTFQSALYIISLTPTYKLHSRYPP